MEPKPCQDTAERDNFAGQAQFQMEHEHCLGDTDVSTLSPTRRCLLLSSSPPPSFTAAAPSCSMGDFERNRELKTKQNDPGMILASLLTSTRFIPGAV